MTKTQKEGSLLERISAASTEQERLWDEQLTQKGESVRVRITAELVKFGVRTDEIGAITPWRWRDGFTVNDPAMHAARIFKIDIIGLPGNIALLVNTKKRAPLSKRLGRYQEYAQFSVLEKSTRYKYGSMVHDLDSLADLQRYLR